MNNSKYAKAYTEVLEIIKYLPRDEYSKIPRNLIEQYKNNMDKNYCFYINPEIALEKQNISKEALSIIIILFRDYFATDKQKEILKILLRQNEEKKDEERRERYNPDNIFTNKNKKINRILDSNSQTQEKNTSLVEYRKQIWYRKIFNIIKSFFGRNK